MPGPCDQYGDLVAGCQDGGVAFDVVARSHTLRRAARSQDAPDMASVDVLGVGAEVEVSAIARQADVLDHAFAGRQQDGSRDSARAGHGEIAVPLLRREA